MDELICERLEFFGLEPSTKKVDSVWYNLYLKGMLVNFTKKDVDSSIKECFNFRVIRDNSITRKLYQNSKSFIKVHNGMILLRTYNLPELF